MINATGGLEIISIHILIKNTKLDMSEDSFISPLYKGWIGKGKDKVLL